MTTASYDRIDWTVARTNVEWTELADQLTAAAEGRERRAAESFERCDTDGFLSQWASGVTAGAYLLAASIARQGGRIERKALFTLDGQFVTAELVDSRYGTSWMIPRQTAARLDVPKRFVTYSRAKTPAKRAAFYRKNGYTVGRIRVAPYVTLRGSSAVSVSACALPDRHALESGDFEVLATRWADRLDFSGDGSEILREWSDEEMAAKVG